MGHPTPSTQLRLEDPKLSKLKRNIRARQMEIEYLQAKINTKKQKEADLKAEIKQLKKSIYLKRHARKFPTQKSKDQPDSKRLTWTSDPAESELTKKSKGSGGPGLARLMDEIMKYKSISSQTLAGGNSFNNMINQPESEEERAKRESSERFWLARAGKVIRLKKDAKEKGTAVSSNYGDNEDEVVIIHEGKKKVFLDQLTVD